MVVCSGELTFFDSKIRYVVSTMVQKILRRLKPALGTPRWLGLVPWYKGVSRRVKFKP